MPVALDYAPPPRSRRKLIRRAAIGVVVIALVMAAWRSGPGVYSQGSTLYAQWKCMHHNAPADQVIYASGPNPTMLPADQVKTEGTAAPWYCRNLGSSVVNPAWDNATENIASVSPAFVHRATKNGQTRLICLQYLDYITHITNYRALRCLVFLPANWTAQSKIISHQITLIGDRTDPSIKVFAGQLDPADDSHFTINVLLGDVPWALDGWLQADDSVKFLWSEKMVPKP